MLGIYYHTCPSSLCQISDQSRFSKRSNWQKHKHLDFWTKKWLFWSKICHFGFKILINLFQKTACQISDHLSPKGCQISKYNLRNEQKSSFLSAKFNKKRFENESGTLLLNKKSNHQKNVT